MAFGMGPKALKAVSKEPVGVAGSGHQESMEAVPSAAPALVDVQIGVAHIQPQPPSKPDAPGISNEFSMTGAHQLRRKPLLVAVVVAVAVIALVWWRWPRPTAPVAIRNFRECVDYGYPIEETSPERCRVPGGQVFVDEASAVAPSEPKTNLVFSYLVDGTNGPSRPMSRLVRTQAEWASYWAQAHAHLPAMPQLLPVDFSHEMVAAIQLGREPSDSYKLKFTSIYEVPRELVVQAKRSVPGADCATASVAGRTVAPYQIVRLPRSDKPVVFDIQTVQQANCLVGDPAALLPRY
jgi:hypothetical protein